MSNFHFHLSLKLSQGEVQKTYILIQSEIYVHARGPVTKAIHNKSKCMDNSQKREKHISKK